VGRGSNCSQKSKKNSFLMLTKSRQISIFSATIRAGGAYSSLRSPLPQLPHRLFPTLRYSYRDSLSQQWWTIVNYFKHGFLICKHVSACRQGRLTPGRHQGRLSPQQPFSITSPSPFFSATPSTPLDNFWTFCMQLCAILCVFSVNFGSWQSEIMTPRS